MKNPSRERKYRNSKILRTYSYTSTIGNMYPFLRQSILNYRSSRELGFRIVWSNK